jgi:hypothetical protein
MKIKSVKKGQNERMNLMISFIDYIYVGGQ